MGMNDRLALLPDPLRHGIAIVHAGRVGQDGGAEARPAAAEDGIAEELGLLVSIASKGRVADHGWERGRCEFSQCGGEVGRACPNEFFVCGVGCDLVGLVVVVVVVGR